MSEAWHCVQCTASPAAAELVALACFEAGSCGLQTDEDGPRTQLLAYFPVSRPATVLLQELRARLDALQVHAELRCSPVAAQDWGREWRRFFRPVWATPRIVVRPSWIPVALQPGQISITIDPKMAFGTGGHETTRLCLRALDQRLRAGAACLDLGTGSGILSIAAVALGAGWVLAVDTDPVALANARENLELNAVPPARVELRLGGVEQCGDRRFDCMVANIQSNVLRPLLPALAARLVPAGLLVLSGILAREATGFRADMDAAGLHVVEQLAAGEWICLVARPGAAGA